MFSVQFSVISCFLACKPILASVVDSLNCNDETVHQKLLFLFQNNTLKLAYGNVETYNLPGLTPDPRFREWEGKGRRGGKGKGRERSAPHSKTLDPPLP